MNFFSVTRCRRRTDGPFDRCSLADDATVAPGSTWFKLLSVLAVLVQSGGAVLYASDAGNLEQPWRERYFAGEPLRIGNRVQLLLDDYAVEDTFNLTRVNGLVEKHAGNAVRPIWAGTALSAGRRAWRVDAS